MKKIFVNTIILVFGLCLHSVAQKPFNFRYTHGLIQSNGNIIEQVDDKYVLVGSGFEEEGTLFNNIYISEINSKSGEIEGGNGLKDNNGLGLRSCTTETRTKGIARQSFKNSLFELTIRCALLATIIAISSFIFLLYTTICISMIWIDDKGIKNGTNAMKSVMKHNIIMEIQWLILTIDCLINIYCLKFMDILD